MKPLNITVVLIFTCLLMFTGCLSQSESLNLAVCGSYAVPGMVCADLKGNTFNCEVIEKDTYGRILFSYKTISVITETEETAYVICQAIDSKNVYYYEDICYVVGEATESEIATLKKENDWDSSLDLSKATCRSNKLTFDLHLHTEDGLDYEKIKEACCDKLDVEASQINDLCILDYNERNQALYFLELKKDDCSEKYCIIVDSTYNITYLEISDFEQLYSQIAQFKQESGW